MMSRRSKHVSKRICCWFYFRANNILLLCCQRFSDVYKYNKKKRQTGNWGPQTETGTKPNEIPYIGAFAFALITTTEILLIPILSYVIDT